MKKCRIIATSLLVAFGICFSSCATNDGPKDTTMNYWDKKKGNCDEVLASPHAYSLSQISYCTKMWETYRYVDDIPLKDRSMFAIAFSTVSHKATDPYDRGIADAALARICIPRHPLDSSGRVREEIPETLECNNHVTDISISGQGVSSKNRFAAMNRKHEVPDVPANKVKEARTIAKKASEMRKKSVSKSISLYKDALEVNEYDVAAKYDLATAYAEMGDESPALRHLEELNTWNDEEAQSRIEAARTDPKFDNIRDNPNFKLITGYVSIALVNAAGVLGVQRVKDMKTKLEKANLPIAVVGESRTEEKTPQIWYREGFDDVAYRIKETLRLKKASVQVLSRDKRKGLDESTDVLVVWGQPEAGTKDGIGQTAPIVQGKRATGSDNKLDDLVKEVEDSRQSIDHAKQAGDSIVNMTTK